MLPLLCATAGVGSQARGDDSAVGSGAASVGGESVLSDEQLPEFRRLHSRPTMGVQVYSAAQAFRGTLFPGQNADEKLRDLGVAVEFMPGLSENMGVFSVGLAADVMPITAPGKLKPFRGGTYALGGLIRYQMRFFADQILVPMGGAEVAYLHYSVPSSGAAGEMAAILPYAGLMLFLNRLDPTSAGGIYAARGVLRSYLTADVRLMTGQNSAETQINATAVTLGLRFEML